MLLPFDNPVKQESALNSGFKIEGNSEVINFITQETINSIENQMDLYQAQEYVVQKVKDSFGESWYEKNAEAVNFLIENNYANALRKEQPFYDAEELYEYNHRTALY